MPDNNPTDHEVSAEPVAEKRPGIEAPFAYSRRAVVHPPIYRGKLRRALSNKVKAFVDPWSVERFNLALLSIFAFGVLGVFIADLVFCPSGTGVKFWEGCMYEVIGFGAGGGVLGLGAFLVMLNIFTRKPTPKSA